ncbi:MAG: hypothetical protein H7X71_02880, partial [Chitinophagales bacterium]|nr:hypothetical protein [Chitinophagales bacterium]
MKNIILFFALLICINTQAEIYYGTNGSNTSDALTPEVIRYINDMIPAGGSYTLRIREDSRADAMPDEVILNVINLRDTMNKYGKQFFAIYTFNCLNKNISNNFYGFNSLIDFGVVMIAAEMGNETYSDSAGFHKNWAEYQEKCNPILNELTRLRYTGKILFPMAPRPYGSTIAGALKNSGQKEWNDPGIVYINSNAQYAPVFHLYYGQFDCDEIKLIGRKDLPVSEPNAEKDKNFKNIASQIIASPLFDNTMVYFKEKFINKQAWFTEVGGMTNTSNLHNTLFSELANFSIYLKSQKYEKDIAVFLKHNGVGPAGIIMPIKRMDLLTSGKDHVRRTGYFCLKLFLKYKDDPDYSAYYNMTRNNIPMQQTETVCITGKRECASSGWVEWWASTTEPTYEIDGYTLVADAQPGLSFGFTMNIRPPVDTVCHDSTYISRYIQRITQRDTTYLSGYFPVYDTTEIISTVIIPSFCYKCENRIYKIRHQRYCKNCDPPFKEADTIIYYEQTIDTTLFPIFKTETLRDTFYIPVDTTITICVDVDTIPETGGIQPLDADTLWFTDITFPEFLVYHGLHKPFDPITKEKSDCIPDDYHLYPDQQGDQYLHEELFRGLNNVVLFSHITTRKMILTFKVKDFCDIRLIITNPVTGQVAVFDDIYRWREADQDMYNLNKNLCWLWGFDGPITIDFPLKQIRSTTGEDLSMDHQSTPT